MNPQKFLDKNIQTNITSAKIKDLLYTKQCLEQKLKRIRNHNHNLKIELDLEKEKHISNSEYRSLHLYNPNFKEWIDEECE
jgi:myo-inositol-1-phosphate synthase